MEEYICTVCNYVYDPAVGNPEAQIDAGVPFPSLPDEWVCPQCGAEKTEFEPQNHEQMPGLVVPAGE